MSSMIFLVLLVAGCAGILLSFAQARSRGVFARDGLTDPTRQVVAATLLAVVLLLTVAIPFAGGLAGGEPQTKHLTIVSLFAVHAVLALFLLCYYLLTRQQILVEFLRLRSSRPIADLASGLWIGLAGWALTVCVLLVVVVVWLFLRRRGLAVGGSAGEVSPTILWLATRPLPVRIGIVVSAMVVEELFFRSFLQTRVGPVAATLMFTAAHGAYGQPLVLVGILVISTVLSIAFAIYGNVLPCIIAHGTFDAIQMFVLIPLALKAA
jgi:membrane protease YdiL (CAAX protease family)